MDTLLVFYDSACPFCVRCRQWLEAQPWIVPLQFVDAYDSTMHPLGQLPFDLGSELVVADAKGQVWVGPEAFLVCLWALDRYRDLAHLLSGALWPLTRSFFRGLSDNRRTLGTLFRPLGIAMTCDGHCEPRPSVGVYR